MVSKNKIIKLSIALIIFIVVIFLILFGHAALKAGSSANTFTNASNKSISEDKASPHLQASASKSDVHEASPEEIQNAAKNSELNNYVLKIINTYAGGKYPYLLNNDYEHYNGVTENIIYQGSIIAKANPDGSKSSHCVGLTYEVFFKAMQLRNKEAGISAENFNNMAVSNMKEFMMTWFAATGNPKSEGDQLAGAIVKYGLGTQISKLSDAEAGDFIDFSRTKSGHTAVFINWLRDSKGNIVGFKYWSTQESTKGIAYKQEYFSDNTDPNFKGTVNRNQLYIGRVGAISDYRPF